MEVCKNLWHNSMTEMNGFNTKMDTMISISETIESSNRLNPKLNLQPGIVARESGPGLEHVY